MIFIRVIIKSATRMMRYFLSFEAPERVPFESNDLELEITLGSSSTHSLVPVFDDDDMYESDREVLAADRRSVISIMVALF